MASECDMSPQCVPLLDKVELRRCFGHFATGVTVVTFPTEQGPRGLTLNSFTSISLEPALVLVSIARNAKAHSQIMGQNFVVNVLSASQEHLAQCFAGQRAMDGVEWHGSGSAPRLLESMAWIACKPWNSIAAGDHTLVLGEVLDFRYQTGAPLGFFQGRFINISEPPSREASRPSP